MTLVAVGEILAEILAIQAPAEIFAPVFQVEAQASASVRYSLSRGVTARLSWRAFVTRTPAVRGW
jgi:hypothetical protein